MARPSRYPRELRERLVARVVDRGEIMAEVAREEGVGGETLRQWVRKERKARAAEEGQDSSAESEELKRLRKELRETQMERDFLKKAAAFFAKEQR